MKPADKPCADNAAAVTDRRFRFIVNTVFFVLLAAIFYVLAKYVFALLLPFVIAFATAALLQRPIALLRCRFGRIPPKAVAAAVITAALATVGTAAVLIVGALIDEISDFANDIPTLLEDFSQQLTAGGSPVSDFIGRLPPTLGKLASGLYSQLTDDLPSLLLSAAEGLTGLIAGSFGAIGSFALRLPSFIITLLITVAAVYFIGTDYSAAVAAVAELIPQRLKKRAVSIKRCSSDTVLCMLKTYAFLMLLTFSELAVGFALFNLMGAEIPYPLPLALITAAVDILPVLGVGTVLIPWAVFDFAVGESARGIMLLVLYAVIVAVRNFLEPRLIGQRFGMHPVLTLLAIYAGGRLFGFIGVFLLPLSLIVAKRLTLSDEAALQAQ